MSKIGREAVIRTKGAEAAVVTRCDGTVYEMYRKKMAKGTFARELRRLMAQTRSKATACQIGTVDKIDRNIDRVDRWRGLAWRR